MYSTAKIPLVSFPLFPPTFLLYSHYCFRSKEMLSVSQIALKVICIQLFMGFFFLGGGFCLLFFLPSHTHTSYLYGHYGCIRNGLGKLKFSSFSMGNRFPCSFCFCFSVLAPGILRPPPPLSPSSCFIKALMGKET